MATRRVRGNWKPPIQGGNGRGPTIPETVLATALSWDWNVVIPTKKKRGTDYPTCYKVDVGNRELKIAVEVDGKSHQALDRQAQDRKKEKFLRGLGWTVLRFSNKQVMESLQDCVRTVMSTTLKLKERTHT